VIPTVKSAPLDEITNKATTLMDTLNALPLREIGNDLQDTVAGTKAIATSQALIRSVAKLESTLEQMNTTAQSLNRKVIPQLSAALEQTRVTLAATNNPVATDSTLYLELKRLLKELTAAARSIHGIADYLERHPEALFKGKRGSR